MFNVTVFGAPAILIPFSPNTANDEVSLKASLEVDIQRSQTGRTSRRAQAYYLRHEMGWVAKMAPADFIAARNTVLDAQDEPVVVPFWPAARKTTDAAAMTSGLTIAWTRGWTSYAINPGSLAGYDYFAPGLMGFLTQPPRLASQTSDYVNAEFSLKEAATATAALIPPAVADTTLATPDGYAAAIFPFTPEGSTLPKLSLGQVDVDRPALGPGRIPSDIFYPQTRETPTQPSYKLKSSADAIALLGWWLRRGGRADVCWVATTQKIGDLAADHAAGVTILNTTAVINANAGDTLALLTTGIAPEFVRVQSNAGGILTLSGPTQVAHPKIWTILVPAILATHQDKELQLSLRRANDDWIATATLAFREAAAEYAATDGETRGATIGRLPTQAWMAKIDLDYAGAIQSTYITNFEAGCTTSDNQVWKYHDFGFDPITKSIDLEEDSTTLHIRWWAGCPWENWRPGQLSATGKITIYTAPVSNTGVVGAPVARWTGTLSKPKRKGPLIDVKVLGANAMFSQKSPRMLVKTTCWKKLYGTSCQMGRSQWQHNGTVTAIAGQQVTIGSIARTDAGAEYPGFGFQDWFAPGYVQWTNASGQILRSKVLASTALAGGTITLTLSRSIGFAVNDVIIVAPGCDHQRNTCAAYDAVNNPTGKFNNLPNFGGFFAVPAVSPNIVIPNSSKTPAKK